MANTLLASSNAELSLIAGSPEIAAAQYLNLLIARNYGGLARTTVDYPNRSIGYRAGRLREDLKNIKIVNWKITGVEDTAAAISQVAVILEIRFGEQAWSGEKTMRLIFADENFEALVRGQPDGAWAVMPDFLTNLWLLAIKPD